MGTNAHNVDIRNLPGHQPPPSQYQLISSGPNYYLWENCLLKKSLIQFTFNISSASLLREHIHSYIWRNNSRYLVSTVFFKEEEQKEKYSIFYQRVFTNLSRIKDLCFEDSIQFYYVGLRGFQMLYQHFGGFEIQEDMFHITQDSKVKVWCDRNISRIYPSTQTTTESAMVKQIIKIIEQNTDHSKSPIKMGMSLRDVGGGFEKAIEKFVGVCKECNLHVTGKLKCLYTIYKGGVENFVDQYAQSPISKKQFMKNMDEMFATFNPQEQIINQNPKVEINQSPPPIMPQTVIVNKVQPLPAQKPKQATNSTIAQSLKSIHIHNPPQPPRPIPIPTHLSQQSRSLSSSKSLSLMSRPQLRPLVKFSYPGPVPVPVQQQQQNSKRVPVVGQARSSSLQVNRVNANQGVKWVQPNPIAVSRYFNSSPQPKATQPKSPQKPKQLRFNFTTKKQSSTSSNNGTDSQNIQPAISLSTWISEPKKQPAPITIESSKKSINQNKHEKPFLQLKKMPTFAPQPTMKQETSIFPNSNININNTNNRNTSNKQGSYQSLLQKLKLKYSNISYNTDKVPIFHPTQTLLPSQNISKSNIISTTEANISQVVKFEIKVQSTTREEYQYGQGIRYTSPYGVIKDDANRQDSGGKEKKKYVPNIDDDIWKDMITMRKKGNNKQQ